jgi:crotonobetainyl-CoA:carnitine CoA-transferase CaiB-like acyl-CoA transferase
MKPLEGLTVLDFSQFLAGPSAAMRLADLGARVIKVERPGAGDLCRRLYISNLKVESDSTLFHSINRNKDGYSANLKDPEDLRRVRTLIARSDVLIENFRPGVMERIGLDYNTVREINPRIVYGTVTGYGREGPWVAKPGQDLLLQALSGLAWLSGENEDGPVPMGLAVADLTTSAHLVQGILACLLRRATTGQGGWVEVSLLESILDLQFEVITTHLNDGGKAPERSSVHNGHAYVSAPYGIYPTSNGHIAIAMGSIPQLGQILGCPALEEFSNPDTWFTDRDIIKSILRDHLSEDTTEHWLGLMEPMDIWCAEVMSWEQLRNSEAYKILRMEQEVVCPNGTKLPTLRCPIRIDGERFLSDKGAPAIGQHNEIIAQEFNLA